MNKTPEQNKLRKTIFIAVKHYNCKSNLFLHLTHQFDHFFTDFSNNCNIILILKYLVVFIVIFYSLMEGNSDTPSSSPFLIKNLLKKQEVTNEITSVPAQATERGKCSHTSQHTNHVAVAIQFHSSVATKNCNVFLF